MPVQIFDKKHTELKAVVIDFVDVKHADLSGLIAMKEVMVYARRKGVLFITMNVLPELQSLFARSHIVSDDIKACSPQLHENIRSAGIIAAEEDHLHQQRAATQGQSLDMESLGAVQLILSQQGNYDSMVELSMMSTSDNQTAQGNPHAAQQRETKGQLDETIFEESQHGSECQGNGGGDGGNLDVDVGLAWEDDEETREDMAGSGGLSARKNSYSPIPGQRGGGVMGHFSSADAGDGEDGGYIIAASGDAPVAGNGTVSHAVGEYKDAPVDEGAGSHTIHHISTATDEHRL